MIRAAPDGGRQIGGSPARPRSGGIAVTAGEVEKVYSDGTVALERTTFDVLPGQMVSLVGPSGCGKSTLLRLVAGLIPITGGSLLVGGDAVTGPRADIGLMFQKPTLLPWKHALDNVILPLKLRRADLRAAREQARTLLEMVGLVGFEFAYPRQLSGGMQQRVALARLLMTGADLLLLDEPFGALDEFTRERLNLELLRIHREVRATSMFVTHNIAEAVFLADRVLVMTPRPGRVAGVVEVPFPHPREMVLTRTPEFNDLVFTVRGMLEGRE